jgi:hypothetical protein
MRSHVPSIFFTVRIDGEWHMDEDARLEPESLDLAALSRHYLREQVRNTLERYSVLDTYAAQDAANAVVSRPLHPISGVTVRGTVQVTTGKHTHALALEHLEREQRGDLDRQETRRRLMFMHQVLSDSDLRRVWWIANYPDRLNDLEQLASQTKDLKPPRELSQDVLRAEVIRFVDQLLGDIRTSEQRDIFLLTLARTFETLGRGELRIVVDRWLRDSQDR